MAPLILLPRNNAVRDAELAARLTAQSFVDEHSSSGHERKSGGATLLVGKQSLNGHHAGTPFVKYVPNA
jgi:hypothetical protein